MQLFLDDRKFGKVLAGIVALGTVILLCILSQRILNSMQFDQDSQIFTLGIGNLIIVNSIMAILMYRKHNIFKSELEG